MLKNDTSIFIGCESDYLKSKIVLFGAPFDGTTSFRPGTRFAPHTIRSESFGIETYSPYQDKDMCEIEVFDSGDLDFPFGNTNAVLDMITERTKIILNDDKIPFMIGGEHLVTLGAVRAVAEKYTNLHILHFDAHTDLREEYLGETLSHATVIKRCWDIVGDNRIYQFGIRSGEKYEFEFAKQHTFLTRFNTSGIEQAIENLRGKPVYLTLDLDILDPSIFPGTGTPEAGGITFNELLNSLIKISELNIVGCDVNELSPVYDTSGVSTAVACKIVRELLLILGGKNNG